MGRKLNLSHLSEAECQHILEVVNKDFNIRYQEKERIREIEADVEADENQYSVLLRSRVFNERHCLCCYSRFLPLINPRVLCDVCSSRVCKSCAQLDQETSERRCKVCLKQRELQKQSNDWFYSSVKKRFRRCGSAKVIRSLYKRRVTDDDVSHETRMLVSRSDSEFATHNWNNLNESIENGSTSSHTYGAVVLPKSSLGGDDDDDSECRASGGKTQPHSTAAAMEGGGGGGGGDQWKRDGKTGGEDEEQEGEGEGDGRFQACREERRSAADCCIQTESEGVSEVGTMTLGAGEAASRFFHSFDGMATVSTEGQELDPEFVTRPHNIRVLEGDALHVEVKVNGTEPLDVLWFCNRNQVQQLDEDDRCEMRRHGNTFVMTIYDVRHDDTREFLCIGVNAVGQCAQGFTVTVDENAQAQLPPTFNNQTDNIEIVPEGSDALLRCTVSAYPEPRITWMRNNRPVMHGGRHRIERHVPGAFQYSLVIESVRADDSGCYVAIARNAAGESRLPIQLLIQPNPIESGGSAGGLDASPQPLSAYSGELDPESSCLENNEADLMRIAQDLSRTQGRFTTTATRMLRSADTMSSMQSQLDAMDKALEGLEVRVLDVLSDDDDDDDDDDDSSDEDSLNNNNSDNRCSWRRLTNDIDDMKSSAKAVGMVTSAALQLLSSAKEIAMETLSENECSGKKQEVEEGGGEEEGGGGEEEEEEGEGEEEDGEGCVYADDLDLSYQELEKLYEVRLISRSELKQRLIQRKSVKDVRAYLRNQSAPAVISASSSAAVAHGDDPSEEDSAMETSVDSLETGPEAKVMRRRRRRRMNKAERTELAVSMCSSSSSGDGKRRSAGSDGAEEALKKEGEVLKETEQQIYLTSGKIFSLEDCIRELETKVMEVDESTPAEILASLENSVARAVAQVTQSDNEVNEIERQVERWMEKRSDRTTKRCNDRFRQEQQLLQPPVTSSSSPDNHETESVVIATTPDAENNTTSIIG